MDSILETRLYQILLIIGFIFAILSGDTIAQPLAKDQDKFLGAGSSSNVYRNFNQYWNQITPGNDGKWGSVERDSGQYNWTELDKIYNYAKNTNLIFKEHTLIWGQQQPSWLPGLDSTQQRAYIERWIQNICTRYLLMSLIDVVNEPFNAPPAYKNALGGDGATGWDWIITAFELARQYSPPGAVLILNEYNVLHSNTTTTNYLNLINLLKDRNLIDGIGIQGHYFEFRSAVDATSNVYVYDINTIKGNLDRLADTGLPVYITEFDIDEPDDTNQLEQYQVYFPIFWTQPGVKGITFWGYIEFDVWNAHPDTYLLRSDGTERPALQWLRNFILRPLPPEPVFPLITGGIVRDPVMIWRSSESAKSYRVQISSSLSFTGMMMDTVVSDTSVQSVLLAANRRYFWHVNAENEFGTSAYSDPIGFMTSDEITTVEDPGTSAAGFALHQNYPNPFNPTTAITFTLPQKSTIRIVLLNILGEEVMNLAEGNFNAGRHQVQLNASRLTSGVYFYRLVTGNIVQTKKLMVIK